MDEKDVMDFISAAYPDASYRHPKIHDFRKFVECFANPSAPRASRFHKSQPEAFVIGELIMEDISYRTARAAGR